MSFGVVASVQAVTKEQLQETIERQQQHYNNLDNSKVGGSDKKEIDFHRFVLFFGHEFSDKIRFFSELEVEHSLSGDGKPGEVELEQAYIDLDINQRLTARAGLFLLPIGIVNETHEPPTFYGTERNPVEKYIIPSTWWEAHAIYSIQGFTIRALYAQWDIDGDGPKSTGQDEQFGYYIEPSYKFTEKFGVFARYNIWDNSSGNNEDTEYQQIDFGVILKFDYQMQNTPDGKNEFDGFNIGIGYQFY